MKRIIFTVTNDLNYDQRMQRICTTLHKAGYEVLLVGRKKPDSLPLANQPYLQKRFNLLFSKGKLFYLEYNIRLFFFLLFQKFDIVCGIDLDTIIPCIWVSGWKKNACVYDAHEWFTEVPEVTRRPSIKKIWSRVEKYTTEKVKYCYTVSEGLAGRFYHQYNRRFEVIRNLPMLSAQPVPDKKEQIVLYQGALNEGRGLESLILAFKNINAKLVLAGEGDLSEKLRQLVIENNLQSKVEFKGYLNPDELKELTTKAFIGINLLENTGLSYYYSLANKFFDYINAGVPSINMNFPEYTLLNQQYEVGLIVNDTEVSTIAQAITMLQSDNKYYIRLRDNCLAARLTLNWEREEKKLLEFYRHIK